MDDYEELTARLRKLAAKWASQARHPQRMDRPAERLMLERHASELLAELNAPKRPQLRVVKDGGEQ